MATKKDEGAAKAKPAKSAKPANAPPAKEAKAKAKPKGKDEVVAAAVAAPAPEPVKPKPVPADPRLKVMKKFRGKFLPKGPLRVRLKEILVRWDSSPEHGDVTVEELKSLLADWRASREKPSKAAKPALAKS